MSDWDELRAQMRRAAWEHARERTRDSAARAAESLAAALSARRGRLRCAPWRRGALRRGRDRSRSDLLAAAVAHSLAAAKWATLAAVLGVRPLRN